MRSALAIQTQVEARLSGRVSAAFAAHVRPPKPTICTGIDAIDRMLGGIPAGAITEVVAAPFTSAGKKTLQAQLLAQKTQERSCALVDATDCFDPKSARAMGTNLDRLLWVRCSAREMKGLEQAFKSADMLLQATGGFGLVVVDLAGVPPRFVRKVPLTTWFRFRAVIEKQETALVFSTPCCVTAACSELTLALSAKEVRWAQTAEKCPSHARVFAGFAFEAEIRRRRSFKKPVQPARHKLFAYPRLA
jgi:hypothetical protein